MSVDPVRRVVLEALLRAEEQNSYVNLYLQGRLAQRGLSPKEKGLVTEIVNGVTRWHLYLDWAISQFCKVPLDKLPPIPKSILRLGAYQILFMESVPEPVACSASVELTKVFSHPGMAALVNAVLRRVAENKENIPLPDREEEPVKYLAVKYSHPEWLVERWLKEWDFEETEALLRANNEPPLLVLRVNRLKLSVGEFLRLLREKGVEAEPCKFAPEGVVVKGGEKGEVLKLVREGLAYAQDEAAILVAHVLSPQPEEKVLDGCAAPGGKTSHIGALMQNRGEIMAMDIHKQRLRLVKETCRKMGVSIVRLVPADGRSAWVFLEGKVDKVLVDVPCSGTGTLRRRSDARWRKSPELIREMAGLQYELLRGVAPLVKIGGVIVYSTCSLEREEDEEVVRRFLERHSEFEPEEARQFLPRPIPSCKAEFGAVRLFPHRHGTDGTFIARLRKRAKSPAEG